MKIINCPKGGKVPSGYCMKSCLNYKEKYKDKKRPGRGQAEVCRDLKRP